MANHLSSEKRIRQTRRKTEANRTRVSAIRKELKAVEQAIASGNKKAAQQALQSAQPKLMSGVSRGVLKKKAASRKMSRLSARVKALAA